MGYTETVSTDESRQTYKLVPPDGGWGYFIMASLIVYTVSIYSVACQVSKSKINNGIPLNLILCYSYLRNFHLVSSYHN